MMNQNEAPESRPFIDRLIGLALEKPVQPPASAVIPRFSAKVVYAIPAMDELRRRFPAYVNPAYDGIVFQPIKVCENVSRETREVEFEYVDLDRSGGKDESLAAIDKRGLRPALPEELIAFNEAYPEEMTKFPIAALGSKTEVNSFTSCVAMMSGVSGRSVLGLGWYEDWWDAGCRFLFVRK
jgi:hypothetical protein